MHLPGLHTEQIFAYFDDETLRSYLPDSFIERPRKADRQFIINICQTLDSHRMDLLVSTVINERQKKNAEKMGSQIKVDTRLLEAIKNPHILSSKIALQIQINRGTRQGGAAHQQLETNRARHPKERPIGGRGGEVRPLREAGQAQEEERL